MSDTYSFSPDDLQSVLGNDVWRAMLDAIPMAITVLAAVTDGNAVVAFEYILANKTAQREAGKNLVGERVYLNDDALLFNTAAEVTHTGMPQDFVYHRQGKTEKWIRYTMQRFANGVLLVRDDITPMKKSDLALQREREQIGIAQAIGHTGSFQWDIAENQMYWSDEMFRIHNLAPQSGPMTMERMLAFVHPEDASRVRRKIAHYTNIPGEEEMLYRLKLPEKGVRHVQTHIISFRGKSGGVTHISGASHDITDRKNAEDQLRHLSGSFKKQSSGMEKRDATIQDYARILNQVHDAIATIDPKGYIVTWNQSAEELYGYTAAEAIGRQIDKLVVPEDSQAEMSAMMEKVLRHGEQIGKLRMTKKCKGKANIHVTVSIVPLIDAAGKITGAAATSKKLEPSDNSETQNPEIKQTTQQD